MDAAPKKMIIAGGGSAGWMTALYLARVYNHTVPNFDITVIESADIGVIGVGEATVHSVRFFLAAMGLDEAEMMRECNATLKTGIMFKNWMKPVNGEMHEYFHPFEHQALGRYQDISTTWFLDKGYERERYDQGVCLSTAFMETGHCPKGRSSRPYDGVIPYGYHIDAVLLGRYLRKKAVEAGVTHIVGTIDDVEVEGENIRSVAIGEDRREADIFIDCTGFRGLLIEKLKDDNWQSFADALPCNKAVAIQREMPAGECARPYTIATALDHGWAWQIDLSNRQGTGYVYDGNLISKEQAEAELLSFLGEDSEVIKCTHLDMKVGCRKEFWIGNCIAVGLSGGFIEPLESTGLHLINLAAGLVGTHLNLGETSPSQRDSFNHLMNGFFADLKNFIVLHYCLTDRDDTEFWRRAPATVEETPWLKNQLEVWKHKICEFVDLAGSFSTIFSDENYRYILYGMNHYPDLQLAQKTESADQMFRQLDNMRENAIRQTLSHRDFLEKLNNTSD